MQGKAVLPETHAFSSDTQERESYCKNQRQHQYIQHPISSDPITRHPPIRCQPCPGCLLLLPAHPDSTATMLLNGRDKTPSAAINCNPVKRFTSSLFADLGLADSLVYNKEVALPAAGSV